MPVTVIRDFLRRESAAGILLVAAGALALVLANSPLAALYATFLDTRLAVTLGSAGISKPLLLWINDGLMAVFFLLVGLEIKREVLEGELSSMQRAALPLIAAIGGMAAPALAYASLNWGNAVTMPGWAIPTATDIAFALGVLALLGDRVPPPLKIFLLALAIIDDLGAIVIIAVFYTANLSATSLTLALGALAVLFVLNRTGVTRWAPYIVTGIFLWVCVLKSGVHATLAGVALALMIPLRAADERGESPLRHMEHTLLPWVSYGILPLFAFANAGVELAGLSPSSLLEPVPLGIAAGLFLGKQLGVFAATWLATRFRLAVLPAGVSWSQVYGVALLTGIGFTMSLFIGTLAFEDPALFGPIRIGVLGGSLLSAIAGYLVLRLATRPGAHGANAARD